MRHTASAEERKRRRVGPSSIGWPFEDPLAKYKKDSPNPTPPKPIVKPLSWRNAHSRLVIGCGFIPCSDYVLDGEHVGTNWVVMSGDRVRGDFIGGYVTLDEAKAAAQADYERRVLSALVMPE